MTSCGRAHDLAHQPGLDQLVRIGVTVGGRVYDQGQVLSDRDRASARIRNVGKPGAAEARYEDRSAIRDIGEGLGGIRGTLVDGHRGLRLQVPFQHGILSHGQAGRQRAASS